jgi:hypothetical protein
MTNTKGQRSKRDLHKEKEKDTSLQDNGLSFGNMEAPAIYKKNEIKLYETKKEVNKII